MSNRIACIGSKNFVLITSLRALITSSAFQDSVGRSLTQSRRSVPYWQVPRHWQVDDYWPWNDRNARGATVTFSSAVFSSRGNLQKVIATRSPLQCQWRSQGLQSWCMIQTTFLTSDVVTGTTLLRGKLRKASHLWVVVSHASHVDDLRSRILQIVLILLGVAVACSRPVTVCQEVEVESLKNRYTSTQADQADVIQYTQAVPLCTTCTAIPELETSACAMSTQKFQLHVYSMTAWILWK